MVEITNASNLMPESITVVEDGTTISITTTPLDVSVNSGVVTIQTGGITSVNGDAGPVVTLDTDDISEGVTNQYYTTARANTDFDTRLATKDTGDLTEGVNLYYTDARVQTKLADVGGHILPNANVTYDLGSDTLRWRDLYLSGSSIKLGGATLTATNGELSVAGGFDLSNNDTGDLPEGSNLYYTTARANTDFDSRLATKTTTDLTEGTNLYYTDGRVGTYLTANNYATQSYVDTGIANLVDSAPVTLDTLNELAAALGDDPNFATTTATALGTKLENINSESIGDLSDVDITTSAPTNGQTLVWNSVNSEFEPGTIQGYTSSDFDTDFATKTTSDLTEGTNLYYTDARAQAVSINALSEDATPQLSADLNANSNYIVNLLDPINNQDAATKLYVDSSIAGASVTTSTATILEVRNTTGTPIAKGVPVYISGHSGTKILVAPADADDPAKMPAIGLMNATLSNNSDGEVISFGLITGIDMSTFSIGDTLYIDTTPGGSTFGGLTNTPPTGETSAIQNIGKVARNVSNGEFIVSGPGRSNATPNLDDDQFFLGNALNQAVATDFTAAVQNISINAVSEDPAPLLNGSLNANTNDIINVGDFVVNGTVTGGDGFGVKFPGGIDLDGAGIVSSHNGSYQRIDVTGGMDLVSGAGGQYNSTFTNASTTGNGISVTTGTTGSTTTAGNLINARIATPGGYSSRFNIDYTGKMTINGVYSFPTADGTPGQVLTTDGLGNLTFATPSGGGTFSGDLAGNTLTDSTGTLRIEKNPSGSVYDYGGVIANNKFSSDFALNDGFVVVNSENDTLRMTTDLLSGFDASLIKGTEVVLDTAGYTWSNSEFPTAIQYKIRHGNSNFAGNGQGVIREFEGFKVDVADNKNGTLDNQLEIIRGMAIRVRDDFDTTNLSSATALTIQMDGGLGNCTSINSVNANATMTHAGPIRIGSVTPYTLPTADGTAGQVLATDGFGNISFTTPASTYGDADVDTHLNTSTATAGQVLSWTGVDYDWVAQSGGGGGSFTGDLAGSILTDSTGTLTTVKNPSGSTYDRGGVIANSKFSSDFALNDGFVVVNSDNNTLRLTTDLLTGFDGATVKVTETTIDTAGYDWDAGEYPTGVQFKITHGNSNFAGNGQGVIGRIEGMRIDVADNANGTNDNQIKNVTGMAIRVRDDFDFTNLNSATGLQISLDSNLNNANSFTSIRSTNVDAAMQHSGEGQFGTHGGVTLAPNNDAQVRVNNQAGQTAAMVQKNVNNNTNFSATDNTVYDQNLTDNQFFPVQIERGYQSTLGSFARALTKFQAPQVAANNTPQIGFGQTLNRPVYNPNRGTVVNHNEVIFDFNSFGTPGFFLANSNIDVPARQNIAYGFNVDLQRGFTNPFVGADGGQAMFNLTNSARHLVSRIVYSYNTGSVSNFVAIPDSVWYDTGMGVFDADYDKFWSFGTAWEIEMIANIPSNAANATVTINNALPPSGIIPGNPGNTFQINPGFANTPAWANTSTKAITMTRPASGTEFYRWVVEWLDSKLFVKTWETWNIS